MSGKDGAHAKRRASPARVRTSRTAVDLAQPVAVASTAAAPPAPPRTPGRKARAPSPHASRRVAAAASGAPAIGAHDSSLNAAAVVAARGSPRDGASDAASSLPTPLHASGAAPGKGALSNANGVGNAVPVQGGVRGGVAPPHEEEEVSRAQHHHHRAHKHKLAQSTSRRRAVLLVLGGLLLALLGSLGVDTAYCLVNKLPWAVSRALPSVRNPAWREARFRETEHATSPQFLQWYHTTISDAATRRVFSFGFGKSLQEGRAGGWLRVKGLHDDEYSTHAWPEQWLPVTALHALGGINVDIVVDNDGANVTLFSQRALGDNQVHVWAHWPHTGDAVNLTLTRTYGTSLKSEDCTLSNIPFAYASSVHGFIRIGGQTFEFDTSPRFRAYVESTWGCTVPRSNIPGADASAYPVR
ncbi:hypothetical protein EON67_01600 [archaeon]|nr:MAG: hypothetical protein EON67_01600 [archaeon]